jgi:hypothetical protein
LGVARVADIPYLIETDFTSIKVPPALMRVMVTKAQQHQLTPPPQSSSAVLDTQHPRGRTRVSLALRMCVVVVVVVFASVVLNAVLAVEMVLTP